VIDRATDEARARRPDLDHELFVLLRRVLLADPGVDGPDERELRARFQQSSGAVMAKSKEDTAFYRYTRFVGANEVGGDPNRFGLGVDAFHEAAVRRQHDWPEALTTLTTHDTKRTEDVRARLAVLTEIPDRWTEVVRGWFARNERFRGSSGPDPATELLLYQTLIGAHPLPLERAWPYLLKVMREAKQATSWVDPDESFESEVRAFVDALLADEAFLSELDAFVAPLIAPGRVNALAQKLLHLCLPGVPDLYQGQELWDLSLVDPDNRRPVDYRRRADALTRVHAAPPPDQREALGGPDDIGTAKLLVVQRALATRAERPDAFGAEGTYEPVLAAGPQAEHVVAFTRGGEVLVVVPRLTSTLDGPLDALVTLPAGGWHDAFDPAQRTFEGTVAASELLSPFPVALLTRSARP
jgi:(1->4)-alpha-D-glucan 1-alpha-D-glucosylmutase